MHITLRRLLPIPLVIGGLLAAAGACAADVKERAIKLSHDKYCSASIMLGKTAEITTSCEVLEA